MYATSPTFLTVREIFEDIIFAVGHSTYSQHCTSRREAARKRCVLHSGGLRSEPHVDRKFLAIEVIEKNSR